METSGAHAQRRARKKMRTASHTNPTGRTADKAKSRQRHQHHNRAKRSSSKLMKWKMEHVSNNQPVIGSIYRESGSKWSQLCANLDYQQASVATDIHYFDITRILLVELWPHKLIEYCSFSLFLSAKWCGARKSASIRYTVLWVARNSMIARVETTGTYQAIWRNDRGRIKIKNILRYI